MEKLGAEQLEKYLTNQGMDPDLAKRLKDEKINGEQFFEITSDLLRACAFKAGEIISIMKFIKLPFVQDQNIGIPDASLDTIATDEASSVSECPEPEPQTTEISKYFTVKEFSKKSEYEIVCLHSQLLRYKRAVDTVGLDKAEVCKPYFVKAAEQKEKLFLRKKKTSSSQPAKSLKRTDLESISESSSDGNESPPNESSKKPKESKEKKQADCSSEIVDDHLQSIPSCSKSTVPVSPLVSRNSQQDTAATRSASANIFSKKQNHTQDAEDSQSLSESETLQGEEEDTELPPFDVSEVKELTGDLLKISAMDSHLPKYDMYKILNGIYQEGKENLRQAIRALKKSQTMLPKIQRIRIMRALTLYLFNSVPVGTKPTPDMKEGLAKSFVLTFNFYLLPSTDKRKPWALVYNRNGTGFLSNTSRALGKAFTKKRKTKKKAVPLESASEYDSDYVKELAVIMPDRSNKSALLDAMSNTFVRRNADRKRGLTVFEFLQKYPHFASYEGEVLREEFKSLYPESRDICAEFARLLPAILQLPEKSHIVIDCDDDTLKGLMLISQHLPHDVIRGGGQSCIPQLKDVVVVMKASEDLEAFVTANGEQGQPIQPYLIAMKGVIGKRVVRTFLVLDRKIIQLQSNTLNALSTLIKSYFVFNVCYPSGWNATFHFLSVCFAKVFEKNRKRPDCPSPLEYELFVKLGGKF